MSKTDNTNIIKDDDEKFLEEIENDKILENSVDWALVEQGNQKLLSYFITGLYKDEKKEVYNTRRTLKKNPPVLTMKDSGDNKVEFVLTKEFSRELMNSLTDVNRAYSGYRYNTSYAEKPIKEIIKEFPDKFMKHKVRYTITIILVLFLLYLAFM